MRKLSSLKLLKYVLLLFVAGVAGVVFFFGTEKIPSKEELKNIQNYTASQVYSEDSAVLGRYFFQNRTNVGFGEISPHIIQALVATEDARFYKHEGVDTRSLFRVLFKTILLGDESSGGGSTISQQLAKNLYPRKKGVIAMLRSKVREARIAFRMEDIYSKEELLTLYLNTVSFGEEVYGIETAAERYFSVKPMDANIQQAATLVGMLKAPSYYNPKTNPDNALGRRNTVLNQMAKYNYIPQETADSLKAMPLGLEYNKLTHETGLAPHFREMLRLQLDKQIAEYNELNGTDYNLYTDGLNIYTTINARMQEYAEIAMRKHMALLQKTFYREWRTKKPWDFNKNLIPDAIKFSERYRNMAEQGKTQKEIFAEMKVPVEMKLFDWEGDEKPKSVSPLDSLKHSLMLLQTGFLAMDQKTGEIKAWIGGIDYAHFKYDHVTAKRQVGSTFKPIVYAAALERGISPCYPFANEPKVYPDFPDYQPNNATETTGGYYTMQGALTNSVNLISVELLMQTGIKNTIELAKKMGITSDLPEVPSLALGSADISLREMVGAYCVLANGGIKAEPQFLLMVTDRSGKVLIDNTKKQKPTRVLPSVTARVMTHFMQSVIDSGTGRSLRSYYSLTSDIAGKTGTTQNHSDGWFIGFTPDLVCGVWVGADNPQIHFNSLALGQGAKTALPIWGLFMVQLMNDPEFQKMKQSHFASMDESLANALNCPMYQPDLGLFEKMFAQKHKDLNRGRNRDDDGDEVINDYHPSIKPRAAEKPTVRERIRRFFGKNR